MSLEAGHKLAHYEILEPIGKGGMGEVYRARDTKLGRDVAIKVLPEAFSQDQERLDRFRREARLLAQLNHANIATLYGLEEHDGQLFLVMELVEGETLGERIAKGPIPVDECVPLFIQIAEGLEAAHAKGIIHRDLKPANIKTGPDGKPKILDFGLAKAFVGDGETASDSSQSPTLTKGTALGAVLGTAAYMSPEQARGKPVDTRTDIWAFGCCLYEALTAAKTFEGESVTDVLAAVVKNEPLWDALPTDTPFRVRDVLRRSLQKDKRMRCHHVADARLELQDAEREPHGPVDDMAAAIEGRTPLVSFVVTALLASLVTVLVFFALGLGTPSQTRPVTRAVLPLEHELYLGLTPSLAISPDGRYGAYVVQDGDTRRLHIRSLEQGQGRSAEGSEGASSPFFSPDGRWVGFHADGSLMKVSVSGGAPTHIANVGSDFRGAQWSADGQIFFSPASGSGLSKVSAEGGTPETVTVPHPDRREKSHRGPEVLPGGKAVLFTLGSGDITSWDDGSIAVLSLDTGEYEVLV